MFKFISEPIVRMGKMIAALLTIAVKSIKQNILNNASLRQAVASWINPVLPEGRKRHVSMRSWTPVKTSHGVVFLLTTTVLTRYVPVANKLHEKDDPELLTSGNTYVASMTGSAWFPVPDPTLASVTTTLTEFSDCISAAANGGSEEGDLLDAKREELLYVLTSLGLYVEKIANDPANAATGPVAIIESAGMRPQSPSTHTARTALVVKPGKLQRTLICTAAAINGNGVHEWQWRLAGGAADSWTAAPSTTASKTTLVDLERGAFIIVRHRTVSSAGTSDWEVYDAIVVP